MAHTKLDRQVISEIARLRTICLIHRYLYYVKSEAIISDQAYDVHERKLKKLVADNPTLEYEADNFSYCPTRIVGSSLADDYPRRIEQLAESLLKYHKEDHGKPDASDMPVLPSASIPE